MRQHHVLNDVRYASEFIGGPRAPNDIDSDKRHAEFVFEGLDEKMCVIHR
jgi:hypothetical protein